MEKIRFASVVANERKLSARRIKKEVKRFLSSCGIRISSSPQLAVTVGGDGTVLFAKKHYGIPFFSIGSSTSFICQANFSDWKRKLARALALPRTEKRLMLSSSLDGRSLPPALNEIGIRNPEPRVLSIHLQAGRKHFAFRADGVMLCTPTGSPAYCYSCGGKQMRKGDWRYQAVAISPFRRLFKPAILPASSAATIRISGAERAQLFIDGQIAGTFREGQTLRVLASGKPFLFLKA